MKASTIADRYHKKITNWPNPWCGGPIGAAQFFGEKIINASACALFAKH